MPDQALSLAEAATQFLSALPPREHPHQQQEVNRFVRWFGTQKRPMDLTPAAIEAYAQSIESPTVNIALKLQPIKDFLAYLRKQRLTESNLGVHVKIRNSERNKAAPPTTQKRAPVHLTAEGHAQLVQELEELKARRPAIVETIRRAAADKDFRENAPLDAAKEQQSHIETRIKEMEALLAAAEILDRQHPKEHVSLGTRVLVKDLSFDEEMEFLLVSPNEVNVGQGKISVASPTGKALLDHAEGDEVEVQAPAGMLRYKILKILH